MTGPHRVAALAAGAGLATLATGTVLDVSLGSPHEQNAFAVATTWVSLSVCAILGVRVVGRLPRHPVGWILVVMAALGGSTFLAEMYAYAGLVARPGRYPGASAADVASFGSWLFAFGGLGYLVLFFPDGKLAGPRWRRLPWVMAVALTGAWLGATVQPGAQGDQFGSVANPAGVAWFGGAGEILVGTFMFSTLGCLVLTAVSAVQRFKRSTGVTRQQMTWLAYSGVLVPLALLACFVGQVITGNHVVAMAVFPVVVTVVPATVGLAVLRYRLYELDHIVSRTVSYALLTVVLFGGYALTAVSVGAVLGGRSAWTVAAATLAAVTIARAVRVRMQSSVDLRFDRAAAESIGLVDRFLADVRDDRAAYADIEPILARALRDPGLRVGLWLSSSQSWVDVHGETLELPDDGHERVVTLVGPAETPLAQVWHRPSLPAGSHLVRTTLTRARLALELARARVESLAHLREIEASRARLVHAGYEERRRLERDLHDGAQQRLVALGLTMRRLQRSLPPAALILTPALDQAVDDIGAAIGDLRRLAAGLRPARLDDGLSAAFEDLARSTPIPLDITVEGERPSKTVETAAYFVACEAVTNAVKHAQASRIAVLTQHLDGTMRIRVTDDGIGGARITPGSGLAGLIDRLAAHGGHFSLHSPDGTGTVIEAVLPCES